MRHVRSFTHLWLAGSLSRVLLGGNKLRFFRKHLLKVLLAVGVVVLSTALATWHVANSAQPNEIKLGWIAATGFTLTALGVLISLAGFAITLEQIQVTNDEVAETQKEAQALRKSLVIYNAAQEATIASYAIKSAKRHYGVSANREFVECYDDFRRAIISIRQNVEEIPFEMIDAIDQADKYIVRLCQRIETGASINQSKVLTEIRSHQDLSANLISILHKVSI